MSVRRCTAALVIATVAAACAASAASAKTKVIFAGGPPPKAGQAGSAKFPAALDLNGFFRRKATIHVGDSVRWVFSKRVVHTVTFLAPGQSRPSLEQPDPANPYTGFKDSTGAPFWFNGQPSLLIPPDHAFPQGGPTMGAQAYHNSGLSAPAFAPYELKFTKKGNYKYICLVHPGMGGKVKVLPKSAAIPSGRRIAAPASPSTRRRSRPPSASPSSSPRATTSSPATTRATWRGSGSSRRSARSRPASPCTSRSPRSRRSTRCRSGRSRHRIW